MISTEIDRENQQIHIVEKGSLSSVPLWSFSYGKLDADGNGEAVGANLDSQVVFLLVGDQIQMDIFPSIVFENQKTVFLNGVAGEERLSFRVVYDYSKSLESGYFSLVPLRP